MTTSARYRWHRCSACGGAVGAQGEGGRRRAVLGGACSYAGDPEGPHGYHRDCLGAALTRRVRAGGAAVCPACAIDYGRDDSEPVARQLSWSAMVARKLTGSVPDASPAAVAELGAARALRAYPLDQLRAAGVTWAHLREAGLETMDDLPTQDEGLLAGELAALLREDDAELRQGSQELADRLRRDLKATPGRLERLQASPEKLNALGFTAAYVADRMHFTGREYAALARGWGAADVATHGCDVLLADAMGVDAATVDDWFPPPGGAARFAVGDGSDEDEDGLS